MLMKSRMNESDFDRRYETIERAADRAPGDQALARLFVESNWTQKEIAKHIGKHQPEVSRSLCFGNFLNFTQISTIMPTGIMVEQLTERAFRELWEKTDTRLIDKRQRYQQIEQALGFEPTPIIQQKNKLATFNDRITLIKEIIAKREVKSPPRISNVKTIVKYGTPNIIDMVLTTNITLQVVAAYVRIASDSEQLVATVEEVTRRGGEIHRKNRTSKGGGGKLRRNKKTRESRSQIPDSQKTEMAKDVLDNGMKRNDVAEKYGVSNGTVDNAISFEEGKRQASSETKLTKQEKEQIKQDLRREEIERQRKLRERQQSAEDPRPRLREPDFPVYMYGIKLWHGKGQPPLTEQERLVVGHYDYDQLFFTLYQFDDWLKIVSLGVKDVPSQAMVMRERLKSSYVFARRRLTGRDQKEILTCIALFQKLADFLRDNPTGKCSLPGDLDGVLNGF